MTDTYVRILLEKSNTVLGKVVQKFSPYPYTHIAYENGENDFVSFSRAHHNNPFESGFTHEKLEYYAYRKGEPVTLKIYTIPVSEQIKKDIESYIKQIEEDEYVFNLYGMLSMPITHGFYIPKAHNCMTFIADIFEIIGIPLVRLPAYKNSIEDLENALLKQGYQYAYYVVENQKEDPEYMKDISLKEKTKAFIHLNKELMKRMKKRILQSL